MDDKTLTFTSISGTARETAEPLETAAAVPLPPSSDPGQAASKTTSRPARDSSTSSSLPHATQKVQSKLATSATNSPVPSRESSPVRPPPKVNSSARATGPPGRSRKNSAQDLSPSRSATTPTNPPSAAATQRALSLATTPNLQHVSTDSPIRAPTPQKPPGAADLKDTPRWPVSPRLRSPPPINKSSSLLTPRKIDQEPPTINVQRLPPSELREGKVTTDSDVDDLLSIPSGMRTPVRGASGASTLETVQELSLPSTPALALDGVLEKADNSNSRLLAELENHVETAFSKTLKSKASNESGSDSGGKSEIKMRSTSAAPPPTLRATAPAKSFSTSAAAGRGKPSGEGSTKNMTVETETVSSIPQIAVGVASGAGNNGSLRTKPSSETIRPKKEKKKSARKTPSVTSGMGEHSYSSRPPRLHHHHSTRGDISSCASSSRSPEWVHSQGLCYSYDSSGATSPERPTAPAAHRPRSSLYTVGAMLTKAYPASSKADIFEAKVASAVDEANSSDSEETFVYESNPPEVIDRPRRFHSRTPSATSMASQVDQRNGPRSAIDGSHTVAMKKSMKFANSYSGNGPEMAAGEDDGKGTARSNMGTGRGTTHHHHIGRWGRSGGNGHPSLFDNESPFPNAAKSKPAGNSPRHSSRPTSPRIANVKMAGNGKKAPVNSLGYDLDDGADDERTPLISAARSARSGRNRRPAASSMRQLGHQSSRQDRSFLTRFAGCLVLSVMVILVISGAIGFMFATTQPLTDVKIVALKNVLASEQDVILDMQVQARNPNLVVVAIDVADMVVFAKSKYAGTDSEWWKRPYRRDVRRWGLRARDDDPSDPPLGDDPTTNPNMEIGHIYELYSPLTFEGSPFKGSIFTSVGQIRVDHPGNKTTPAGSERWGRVVQHEFELIVRGTLKYSLPLSQKVRSISVEGRVTVKPNAADRDPDLHI